MRPTRLVVLSPLLLAALAACGPAESQAGPATSTGPAAGTTTTTAAPSSVDRYNQGQACLRYDKAVTPVMNMADTIRTARQLDVNTAVPTLEDAVSHVNAAAELASEQEQVAMRRTATDTRALRDRIASFSGAGTLNVTTELAAVTADVRETDGWCRSYGAHMTHPVPTT